MPSCIECGSANVGRKFCTDCGASVGMRAHQVTGSHPPGNLSRGSSAQQHPALEQGPSQAEGHVFDLSDRPLLCLAVSPDGQRVTAGSASHSLYEVDLLLKKKKRELYSKRCGHAEWVTCVAYTADSRVLSGAMDSKICSWDPRGVLCRDLNQHSGSIAQVLPRGLANPRQAVSASYDKTVKVWDVPKAQCVATLKGHKAAVVALAISSDGTIASASRDGAVIVWDLNTEKIQCVCAHVHSGPVECLLWTGRGTLVTAGKDGVVLELSPNPPSTGKSAQVLSQVEQAHDSGVNDISLHVASDTVVTAGGDGIVQVYDERMAVVHSLEGHRGAVYCVTVYGDVVFSGNGGGAVLAHSIHSGQCLYGLGASSAGAVRSVLCTGEYLAGACEDGNLIVWDMV